MCFMNYKKELLSPAPVCVVLSTAATREQGWALWTIFLIHQSHKEGD
uniref:Uncharacterized protein n=1 Tax=Picea glauca TaxID=3330 RepID=A0A101LU42_PICGL|nr:hypothetical protein ABT39_MTgene3445 [Picea glauca]